MAFLHLAPWTLASSQGKSLAAKQRSKGGAISGVRVSGGRGFEGEKRERPKSYLWRGLELADVDRGGLAAKRAAGGGLNRRRRRSRGKRRGVAGCRRFRAARWSWLRGLWGARKSGRIGSAEA